MIRHNATSINKDLIFDLVLLLDLYFYFIHSIVVIFFGGIGISWEVPSGSPVSGLKSMHK